VIPLHATALWASSLKQTWFSEPQLNEFKHVKKVKQRERVREGINRSCYVLSSVIVNLV